MDKPSIDYWNDTNTDTHFVKLSYYGSSAKKGIVVKIPDSLLTTVLEAGPYPEIVLDSSIKPVKKHETGP